MSKQMIAELSLGDAVSSTFLVNQKSLIDFRNKEGHWLSLVLADRTGTISGRAWDNATALDSLFKPGDVVAVDGRVEEYRGNLQLIINDLRPCAPGEFSKSDFMRSSKRDSAVLIEAVGSFIAMVTNPYLKALLESFFGAPQFIEDFSTAPGAKGLHHSHIGGLLEHTVGVVKILLTVRECHPELDLDMLITGGLLHDIGKLQELTVDVGIDYSDGGRLLGHIIYTDRMVNEAINTINGFPQELADRLCHVLISHHGQKEYGAPVVPMTVEACALHYADNLDAHVQYFQQVVEAGAASGNRWSEYQKLFDRYIYIGDRRDSQ